MPRRLEQRLKRIERLHETPPDLLRWTTVPIGEWPDRIMVEFLKLDLGGRPGKAVLSALSQQSLEQLIERMKSDAADRQCQSVGR